MHEADGTQAAKVFSAAVRVLVRQLFFFREMGRFFCNFSQLEVGVLQGYCLAPALFGRPHSQMRGSEVRVYFVYADDNLLLTISVHAMQKLIGLVEQQLQRSDLRINVTKSCCAKMGTGFDYDCAAVVTDSGQKIAWYGQPCHLGCG